jgi:hypothetical protein
MKTNVAPLSSVRFRSVFIPTCNRGLQTADVGQTELADEISKMEGPARVALSRHMSFSFLARLQQLHLENIRRQKWKTR